MDDDPLIRELLKFFLEEVNFIVQVCSDGYDAIEVLKKNHFDLMILDISMPGMSGFDTLAKLRKISTIENLRVLMLTSNQHVNDVIKATGYGIVDYVIKPPKKAEFLLRVERALVRKVGSIIKI